MKVLVKKFKDLSIAYKFIISLFLFLILPLSVVILWVNNSLISNINEQNLKTNLAVLKQTKTPIVYLIQDLDYLSLQVLGNEDLQQFLSSENKEAMKDELVRLRFELNQLAGSKEQVTRLSVFDEDSLYIQSGSYLKDENASYIDNAAALKGKPYWVPATYEEGYVSKWDRMYEVAMIRAINNFRTLNDIIGYERINISEDYLCSLYEDVYDAGTAELFIVNKDGDVVSSVSKELLGKNIAGEAYFDNIINAGEGYLRDGSRCISYYSVEKTGWYVVKIDNISGLTEGRLFNSMAAICLVFIILFGIVFTLIQVNWVIRPVRQLSDDVSRFREDSYEINQYNDSDDEIGVLNRSFIQMGQYIKELIERVYKSRLKEQEAQLNYLQSQINPHFLYNTLDSMRWMAIKEKQYEIAEQMEALADLFRHALNSGKDMTTIGEEVEHLKSYLLIQQNKLGDRLHAEIDVEEDLKSHPTVNLILQPLTENAIVHGIGPKVEGGNIKIRIYHDNHNVYCEVSDDGVGTDEKRVNEILASEEDSHNALALDNINKRIKYKYGDEYGIKFMSSDGGTTVVVTMPRVQE